MLCLKIKFDFINIPFYSKKLPQLRKPFNKRIPIVHHPNQTTLFDLYFSPLRKHPYVSNMARNIDNIYVLQHKESDSNLDNFSDVPTPTPGKMYVVYCLHYY
jgi:hypothetical protein